MAKVNDGLELLLRLNATIPASINSLAEDLFGINSQTNRERVINLVNQGRAKECNVWFSVVDEQPVEVQISARHAELLQDTFCPRDDIPGIKPEAFTYLASRADLQALVAARSRRRGRDISEQ